MAPSSSSSQQNTVHTPGTTELIPPAWRVISTPRLALNRRLETFIGGRKFRKFLLVANSLLEYTEQLFVCHAILFFSRR